MLAPLTIARRYRGPRTSGELERPLTVARDDDGRVLLPDEGERCVVVAWPLDADGRKRDAATALYGADGSPLAVSRQLWIEPRISLPAGSRIRRRGSLHRTQDP